MTGECHDTQSQSIQTARFEARISKHIHDTIKLASQMTGRTMSDFVMSIAMNTLKMPLNAMMKPWKFCDYQKKIVSKLPKILSIRH